MTAEAARIMPSGCPPDDTFARLLEGTLAEDAVRALESHCDTCFACARAMAELARTITPDRGDWLGGRYRVLEPLAAGGMGVVYTAFDSKLQRKVAVKRLREAGGDATAERRRARVLREAQLLASLSHPNVLTVHDVGEIDREIYVVMELVDGWPMSRWISEAEPRPGWRRIVDLYLEAGRGLSAAHKLGVVHRDIKPENILVGRSGRVLIGDFGLAGVSGSVESAPGERGAHVGLTQTGAVLGTPAYMAPEQHEGKASDALSDQFSFCVSLYESLHGRRPFPGETAGEIAAAVRAGRLALGGDGVPRAIDRVIATGLAADRTRRHPSMDRMLERLARARHQGAARAAWLAGGGLILVAAIGVATAILRSHESPPVTASVPTLAPMVGQGTASPPSSFSSSPSDPPPPPGPRPPPHRNPAAKEAAARARRWASTHPERDPQLLLYLADRAHADRDGAGCLTALRQIPADAWPAALADRALRRRASCEMLRGKCRVGRRLLERVDGVEAARRAELADCPTTQLGAIENRILAVAAQADEARYAGNRPARRKELEQALLRQTAAPEIQTCFRSRKSSRACARRLGSLARAYQVLAESFLAAGDCRAGADLDVMQSQVKFQGLGPDAADPALRCRASRIFETYPTCAPAGEAAERRCLTRIQAAKRDGVSAGPELR